MWADSFKVDFIKDAYSQLRISGITVEPTPDDLELALMRLEAMAAQWEGRNICANYNFEDQPDPNSETNVDRKFAQAFSTNLALRLVPDFGKTPSQVLASQASASLSYISSATALNPLNEVPYPSRQPVGSGNSLRYYRWWRFYHQFEGAPNNCDTNLMTVGDVNDYVETYDTYLQDNEYIASYAMTVSPGLELMEDETDGNKITYRIKAVSDAQGNDQQRFTNTQQVTIATKTNEDRVLTRFVYFKITDDGTRTAEAL